MWSWLGLDNSSKEDQPQQEGEQDNNNTPMGDENPDTGIFVEYRCEETGAYLGEKELTQKEVDFANMMQNIQRNLNNGAPVEAFEKLLHAIRLTHPESGEQAILNYLNQARNKYANENPENFRQVQQYISDIQTENEIRQQQQYQQQQNQFQPQDEDFDNLSNLLSSLTFSDFSSSSTLSSTSTNSTSSSFHNHNNSHVIQPRTNIPSHIQQQQHTLMNEIYHAILQTALVGPTRSSIGSTSAINYRQNIQDNYNSLNQHQNIHQNTHQDIEAQTAIEAQAVNTVQRWANDKQHLQESAIIDQQGLGQLVDLVLQDGSSIHCQYCNGVIPKTRHQAHCLYWCERHPLYNNTDVDIDTEAEADSSGMTDQTQTQTQQQHQPSLLHYLQSNYPKSQ